MESTPVSSCYNFLVNPESGYEAAIAKLQADEASNPQNAAMDQKQIALYQELEANFKEQESVAAAYRKSDNDPNLATQLRILTGQQQTLTQMIQLNSYIQSLQTDMQKNPQDTAADQAKIENAEAQQQCIQQFESAWEAYQQTGEGADQVNALIEELQKLREENPDSPLSSGPIWEDRQAIESKYTVFSFDGQKYAVGPS